MNNIISMELQIVLNFKYRSISLLLKLQYMELLCIKSHNVNKVAILSNSTSCKFKMSCLVLKTLSHSGICNNEITDVLVKKAIYNGVIKNMIYKQDLISLAITRLPKK